MPMFWQLLLWENQLKFNMAMIGNQPFDGACALPLFTVNVIQLLLTDRWKWPLNAAQLFFAANLLILLN